MLTRGAQYLSHYILNLAAIMLRNDAFAFSRCKPGMGVGRQFWRAPTWRVCGLIQPQDNPQIPDNAIFAICCCCEYYGNRDSKLQ